MSLILEVIESRGNKNQECVSPPFRGGRFCILPVLTYPMQVAEQGAWSGPRSPPDRAVT